MSGLYGGLGDPQQIRAAAAVGGALAVPLALVLVGDALGRAEPTALAAVGGLAAGAGGAWWLARRGARRRVWAGGALGLVAAAGVAAGFGAPPIAPLAGCLSAGAAAGAQRVWARTPPTYAQPGADGPPLLQRHAEAASIRQSGWRRR